MHLIGQILNYDYRKEKPGRGTQSFHAPTYIEKAPKVAEDDEEVVTEFIMVTTLQ